MSSIDKNPAINQDLIEEGGAKDMKIGIVVSLWNKEITDQMKNNCFEALINKGCTKNDVVTIDVPGAYELPFGARLLSSKDRFDGIICLGCVIKGDTKHDDYINNAVANGAMQLGLTIGIPIVFGLLTTNNTKQAKERSNGVKGDKGKEAALTAISMIKLAKSLKEGSRIGF